MPEMNHPGNTDNDLELDWTGLDDWTHFLKFLETL